MWTPNPFFYEFGRPFPAQDVQRLFDGIAINAVDDRKLVVFEPGAGSGRILVPLAQKYTNWVFYGSDFSEGMCDVFNYKIVANNLQNISISCVDEFNNTAPLKADAIIISSFLHAVREWQLLFSRLLRTRLADQGMILLVGEAGDIYDCALGRFREGVDAELEAFWSRYRTARQRLLGDSLEASQVGIRWNLDNEEAAAFLLQQGFEETRRKQIEWSQRFRVSDLFRIIKERCYSSMFTLSQDMIDNIYQDIKETMTTDMNSVTVSRHTAVLRRFERPV